jgi:hypothetical protein
MTRAKARSAAPAWEALMAAFIRDRSITGQRSKQTIDWY